MSLMAKSLHIMNSKGGSKSHGSNAHEIWTRGSTFHGDPFLMVHRALSRERALSGDQGPSLRCYGDVPRDSDGRGVRAAHEDT